MFAQVVIKKTEANVIDFHIVECDGLLFKVF